MTADEQTPEWEGATNLRHLSGAVYRMGLPERITARGWQQMAADGVTTLVDLRNDDELGRREPGWAGVDPPESISVVHRPVEDQSNAEFMDLCPTILD
ncbi:MAG: tyrosine-protein phosphatase, partial [Propionibacteriales bacterium]|nr:tyrosine-protein phosphatase [Propionibacteriales bacterium]